MGSQSCKNGPRLTTTTAIIIAIFISGLNDDAQAQKRPYTVDDYLSLEALGNGESSDQFIVWEQAPPYDELGYFGHGFEGAWNQSGFFLNTVDLTDDAPQATQLFSPEQGVSYWIDSVSPDGRYISFHAAKEGIFFVGAYDAKRRRIRNFDAMPVVDLHNRNRSVWVSPEEFIFSANIGDSQSRAATRVFTGHRLAQEWETAWAGGVSVSVNKTGMLADNASERPSDALLSANARTGKLTTLANVELDNLLVSHDGRLLAGLRQRERRNNEPQQGHPIGMQLVVIDLPKGAQIKAAPGLIVSPGSLAWAHDETRLAFFAWKEGQTAQSGIFFGLDLETGALTPYPHAGLDLSSQRERGLYQRPERVVWLGDQLAVFARAHMEAEPKFTYRDVLLFGGANTLDRPDWYLLDKKGQSKVLTAQFKSVSPIPLNADGNSVAILADGDAWSITPNGQARNLTQNVSPALNLPITQRFSPQQRPFKGGVVLVAEGASDSGFALVDFAESTAWFVSSPAADAEFVSASVKSGAVIFRYDSDQGTQLILKRAGASDVILDTLNSHMAEVEKTKWRTIDHKIFSNGNETAITSCILLPLNYVEGARYPVIVEVYPTRGANCTEPSWQRYLGIGRRPGAYSEHLLAAQGYIVFRPSTPANLIHTDDGLLGGITSLVEQGVNELVRRGYADNERVGLLGFSQGGVTSLSLATQSPIFKATVSLNGWSDFYTHYYDTTYLQKFYSDEFSFSGSAGRYLSMTGTAFPFGKKPNDGIDSYIDASPLYNAAKTTAPVLLIHSDMDIFALHQYERMYVALNLEHKKAKLLRYWGEGHGPSSPGNIRHMWEAVFDWFDCHLKDFETSCD